VPSPEDQMYQPSHADIPRINNGQMSGPNVGSYTTRASYGEPGFQEQWDDAEKTLEQRVDARMGEDIDVIFKNNEATWERINNTNVAPYFNLIDNKPKDLNPEYAKFIKYLRELNIATGLKPLEKNAFTLGSHDETVEEYVRRALAVAIQHKRFSQMHNNYN